MLEVTTVEMNPDSREEYLPGYTPQFPHIASHVVAARYESSTTPMLAAAACCGRRPGSAHQTTEENERIVLHSGGCEIAARCAALLY